MTMESRPVNVDIANALTAKVGDAGLSMADINGMAGRVSQALDKISERYQDRQIAFQDLTSQEALLAKIECYCKKIEGRFRQLVVLGIGGSALGGITIQTALNHTFNNLLARQGSANRREVFFYDNVDPDQFSDLLSVLKLEDTLFIVITKSGNTAETVSSYLIVRQLLREQIGASFADHILAITDPEQGNLRKIAVADGCHIFEIPPLVGGRFSVLSAVGLVPAAISGVDVRALLAGAAAARDCCEQPDLQTNPAAMLAAIYYLFETKHDVNIFVMMPYSQRLRDIADWYRQLWAESLGKCVDLNGQPVRTGTTPVKALGVTDQHSQVQLYAEGPADKLLTFLAVDKFSNKVEIDFEATGNDSLDYLRGHNLGELLNNERLATAMALCKSGKPNITINVPEVTPHTLGQLFYIFQMQTAICGELLNIDTYNQPGVEEGKDITYGLMGREGYDHKRAEFAQFMAQK